MSNCQDELGTDDLDRHCGDCDVLTDALRNFEQQRRQAEDERWRQPDGSDEGDEAYLAKLKALEHLRDCALEVLLKHQSLEHR